MLQLEVGDSAGNSGSKPGMLVNVLQGTGWPHSAISTENPCPQHTSSLCETRREGSKLKESTKEEMNQKGHSTQDNIPGFSMPQLGDRQGEGPHEGGLSQNA